MDELSVNLILPQTEGTEGQPGHVGGGQVSSVADPEIAPNDDPQGSPESSTTMDPSISIKMENTPAADQKRCLICYYMIDSSNLPLSEQKYKVENIYKTFNIKSASKSAIISQEFNPPLCPMCSDTLKEAAVLIGQMEELECSLSILREQLKTKLVSSFDEEHLRHDERECELADVELIRLDVMKYISKYCGKRKKKVGRPKKESTKDVKPSIPNPYILLEKPNPSNTTRTSKGRLIKRPQTILYSGQLSDSEEEVPDEQEEGEVGEVELKPVFDEDDLPDPEWSPGQDEDEFDMSSNPSESDEELEALSENALDALDMEVNEGNPTSHHKRRRSKHKPKKSLGDVEVETKKLKPRDRDKIPIKIIGIHGEELEGIYIKKDSDSAAIKSDEEGNELEKIQPGSVVSIMDEILGIRIKCTNQECKRTFGDIDRMNLHVKKIHQGVLQPYECMLCGNTFSRIHQLRLHMKQHGVEFPDWMGGKRKFHVCEFGDCKQQYRNPSELQVHVRVAHTHEKPFLCCGCDETFVSALKRENHIEQAHHDLPPLKCEHCPKAFFRQHRLREHIKTHTGERSYLCEICSKSFSQPAYLRYHQTTHAELSLQPYKCDQCEKTFATPVNLRIHKRTQHQNDYRFRCEICNHGATHLSHLRLHMRTHSGERPHICEVCSKSFTRGSQLKIHIRSHTGERPYICKTCEKTFTNSSKLRRHELTHSQVKPFKCRICEKGFSQMSNLNSHMKCAHTNKVKGASSKKKVEEPPLETCVFQPHQVFGIQQQNLSNIPIQFQVVNTTEGLDAESTYTEFIILNQV